MGHCPGCGANVTTPPSTYGHILGCGIDYPGDPMQDRLCPWDRDAQTHIIETALADSKILGRLEIEPGSEESRELTAVVAMALKAGLDRYNEEGP